MNTTSILSVAALEEQVEEDEEALGDVLGGLGHGAGDVHQAKHHRLGTGVRLFDEQVVFQVEGVEERHTMDARTELLDFRLDFLDIAEVIRFFALQARQLFLGLFQLGAAAARQGDTPCMGRAQGTDDIDP